MNVTSALLMSSLSLMAVVLNLNAVSLKYSPACCGDAQPFIVLCNYYSATVRNCNVISDM